MPSLAERPVAEHAQQPMAKKRARNRVAGPIGRNEVRPAANETGFFVVPSGAPKNLVRGQPKRTSLPLHGELQSRWRTWYLLPSVSLLHAAHTVPIRKMERMTRKNSRPQMMHALAWTRLSKLYTASRSPMTAAARREFRLMLMRTPLAAAIRRSVSSAKGLYRAVLAQLRDEVVERLRKGKNDAVADVAFHFQNRPADDPRAGPQIRSDPQRRGFAAHSCPRGLCGGPTNRNAAASEHSPQNAVIAAQPVRALPGRSPS